VKACQQQLAIYAKSFGCCERVGVNYIKTSQWGRG